MKATTEKATTASSAAAVALKRANDNADDIDEELRPRLKESEIWRAKAEERENSLGRTLERIERSIDKMSEKIEEK